MAIFKNLFGQTSNKAEVGSHQEITTVSDINRSVVKIINNYYGTDNSVSKEELKCAMNAYLDWLIETCTNLDWFKQVAVENENAPQLTLDSVYTALLTTSLNDTKEDNQFSDKQNVSAVEMLNLHKKLVIAGAPGSGKSAFVNFVCLCMAGELRKSPEYPHCNLNLLTQPLPDDKGKPQAQKQQWQHGALVPLRIILRDFVSWEHFPQKAEQVTAKAVLNFIELMLQDNNKESFFPVLKKCLDDGEVLVMFDGLDEVPEADKRREVMKNCIAAFYTAHSTNRFLVTVRPYAYEKTEWKLKDFKETMLANFSRGQICLFIDLWYQDYDKQKVEVIEKRAEKLKEKIFGIEKEKLQEMAERPLLLTLIAFLDCNQHQLPERRAELYEELLKILIEKWEKARFDVNNATEARDKKQLSLSEYLRVGYEAIHLVLQRLAFNAHSLQPKEDKNKCADISATTLRNTLFELAINTRVNPVDLDEYLRDRVGILNLRGGDNKENSVYSFPHRSFQEYLAAEYFDKEGEEVSQLCKDAKGDGEWEDFAAYLGQTDPGRWREVVILAGAIYAGRASMRKLIKALLADIQEDKPLTLAQSWGLRLAGEILAENKDINPDGNAVKQCKQTLQALLPKLLTANTLPASERVTAGLYLAKIDDTRPEIMDVDAMQFCWIPKGDFYLGGDDKAYGVGKNSGKQSLDDDYALARFPVTVAQYQ